MNLLEPLQALQKNFTRGATRSYAFRQQQLLKLKKAIYANEQALYQALYTDLKKNAEECWITELGVVVANINYTLKKLHRWMKPQKVPTNLLNYPGKSYVLHEPLGVVLIISPWNYPVQLLLVPLVGAIAAGNCAVLKPSEMAPATAAVLEKIIRETFDADYISIVQGNGAEVIPDMMQHFRFDHVFYTGGVAVGTLIYQMAAKQLVPVTLELGGKNPCIVESDADIKVTARRIAMTKFSNAGQMCVAPDYLLVHESILERLINALKEAIHEFYMSEKVRDYHYGKIINEKQFQRLVAYLQQGNVVHGGNFDASRLFIEPTILTQVPANAPVLNEEIFGPLLPVVSWQSDADVYELIQRHPNPLALYVFTTSKTKAEKWTRSIAFGGGCINNASWQFTNHHLPFGGVGKSGIGHYHGWYSFEAFSYKKAIMKTPLWFDPFLKYPPFKGKLSLFKKIFR